MRTCSIALVIFLLLFGSFFLYDSTLKKESATMLEVAEKLHNAADAENWEDVKKAVDNLEKAWEKTSPRLAAIAEHDILHEIMLETMSARAFAENYEKPELLASVMHLEALFRHIAEQEELSLENIL